MLYIILFLIVSAISTFLTFLKFESENLRPIEITFTIKGIFNKAVFVLSKILIFMAFSVVAINALALIFMFFSYKIFCFFRNDGERGEKNESPYLMVFIFNLKNKFIDYNFSFNVRWDFLKCIFLISFGFLFVLYKAIFFDLYSNLDFIIMAVLVFISILLFSLEFGYERIKACFLSLSFLSVIFSFIASYFTLETFSSQSDVSPEKSVQLLFLANVIYIFFLFVVMSLLLLVFTLYFLIFYSGFLSCAFIFGFFKEGSKSNTLIGRYGVIGILIFVVFFAGLISPMTPIVGIFKDPVSRFEQAMSEFFFSENKERCFALEPSDKIYFYEVGRAIKYSPEDENKIKYRDVDCNSKKEKTTEKLSAEMNVTQ